MKRVITDKEIEYIIDFIKPSKSIPLDSAISIVNLQKDRLRNQLKNQMIYPSIIDELKETIKKNYIDSLIQPGESVGIIAAQSIGERQTQNSIAYDEEILINYFGTVKKLKIGQFIDNYMREFGSVQIDNHSYVKECDNIDIMTISPDEKIEWKKITEISKHSPKGNLVKVTTESGRSVISTLSHSHLKKHERKVVPVLGSDLKLGDKIPVVKRTLSPKCYGNEKIDVVEYINVDRIGPFEYDSDGDIPESSVECIYIGQKRFNRYIELDELFIWFLGVVLGSFRNVIEKCKIKINDNNIIIVRDTFDDNFDNKIKEFCNKYDLVLNFFQKNRYFFQPFIREYQTTYEIHSTIFVTIIRNLCNNNKTVPTCIFGLEIDKICLFLKTYFEEGGLSMSGEVTNDISFLLTYFGIYSRRNYIGKLLIQKKYYDVFNRTFGVYIDKNNLEDDFQTFGDIELNKEANRVLYEIKKEPCDTINTEEELENFISNYILNAHEYNQTLYRNYIDIAKNLEYFNQVKRSDVVWEKIVKLELIEEKDYNNSFVYDFSVKGNETFALFSGIVVHNTLNTFHKAGQSEKSVTVGVPRFSELLNATKTPKMVNCKIYFNEGNETVHDLRETISHKLVHITLKDLIKSIKICMNKEEEGWYNMFKILYNSNFSEHLHCISIKLDHKIMFKYRLNINDIAKQIEDKYSDLYCVFSPPDINQLDIFVDVTNIQFTQKQLLFITPDNAQEIYLDECVQPLIEDMTICGIYGIQNIYYTQENDEWFVETDGSNFKKILGCNIVDMTRTISNNVWDIYEVLGIEAAREFLISEFVSIMDGINLCHVKLLVEKMTFSGTICSISRYTLRKEESGPMSKASFEETLDNYLRAAITGDIEKTRGVSASIICGKRANIGTGMMDLRIDIKRLPSVNQLFKNEGNVIEE